MLFCGEPTSSTQTQLVGILGQRARFAHVLPSRRASWLAELALAQASRGESSDVMSLEPLYLRRPAITRSSKFALPSQAAESNRAGDNEGHAGEERKHRMRYIVERMTMADIPRIVEIERLAYATPWPPSAYRKELEENQYAHYIVVTRHRLRPLRVEPLYPADSLAGPSRSRCCRAALLTARIRIWPLSSDSPDSG